MASQDRTGWAGTGWAGPFRTSSPIAQQKQPVRPTPGQLHSAKSKTKVTPAPPLSSPAAWPPPPQPQWLLLSAWAGAHLLAGDEQHAVLLAVLQLPVDVVEHQQLTPAVLQQLHLVAHLKHSQSSAADTHRAGAQPATCGRGGSPGYICMGWFLPGRRGSGCPGPCTTPPAQSFACRGVSSTLSTVAGMAQTHTVSCYSTLLH